MHRGRAELLHHLYRRLRRSRDRVLGSVGAISFPCLLKNVGGGYGLREGARQRTDGPPPHTHTHHAPPRPGPASICACLSSNLLPATTATRLFCCLSLGLLILSACCPLTQSTCMAESPAQQHLNRDSREPDQRVKRRYKRKLVSHPAT